MLIRLTIENADRLPDGGPLQYQADSRGFDIGREGRQWTLPDPRKLISGRHCEVVWEKGGFWLHDTSRNGTFLNGSSERMASPHRLRDGDRIRIGHYIVSVALREGAWGRGASDATAGGGLERAAAGGAGHAAAADGGTPPQTAATFAAGRSPAAGIAGRAPQGAGADMLLEAIAEGAGVPAEMFRQRDPEEVGREIGAVLRTTVDELALLLRARATAKTLARSGHRTMIGSVENNPLKFVPASEEIIEIMFTRRRPGYLDARKSVEAAFEDLKTHEMATYSAMQSALARLLDDLSPETVEGKVTSSTFSSRKSRAWDALVAVWRTLEEQRENGMLDVFLEYFGEAYARASKQKQDT